MEARITLEKLTIILLLLLYTHVVYAYDEALEPILQNSPNIEATEYILILNNNLEKSLDYLAGVIRALESDEPLALETQVRVAHLQYLTAYSYIFHASAILKKRDKLSLAISVLDQLVPSLHAIAETHTKYSDVLRVLAVSRMLYGSTGIQGISKFLHNKGAALQEIQLAIDLNPKNMMARVVLNNFDALAPKLIGADPKRGYSLIFVDFPPSLPKPHQFEVLVSRLYAYKKNKEQKKAKLVLNAMNDLYQNSWRATTVVAQ